MPRSDRPLSAVYHRAAYFVRRGFAQRKYAADKAGQTAQPSSAEACSWCALGALLAATDAIVDPHGDYADLPRGFARVASPLIREMPRPTLIGDEEEPSGYKLVADWNDAWDRTQGEVAAKFDAIAARLEAEGQ